MNSLVFPVARFAYAPLRLMRNPHALFGGRAAFAGLMLLLAGAAVCGAGCSVGSGNQVPHPGGIDLTERFAPVEPLKPGEVRKHFFVIRRGERRESLVLVAPAAIRMSLEGASGTLRLEGMAAPVFNVGDGIRMNVSLIRGGAKENLMSRYFDAGRNAEDRGWLPLELLFRADAGDSLEIEISGGPQGDLVADWLALSSLRILPLNALP